MEFEIYNECKFSLFFQTLFVHYFFPPSSISRSQVKMDYDIRFWLLHNGFNTIKFLQNISKLLDLNNLNSIYNFMTLFKYSLTLLLHQKLPFHSVS